MGFDIRAYFRNNYSQLTPETIEKFTRRAEELFKIEKALGRSLTEKEKSLLSWLSGWDAETASCLQGIFDELNEKVR